MGWPEEVSLEELTRIPTKMDRRVARIQRHRRLRWTMAGVITAGVLVAFGLTLANSGHATQVHMISAPPSTTSTTYPSADVPEPPMFLTFEGNPQPGTVEPLARARIVEVSPSSGQVIQTLAPLASTDPSPLLGALDLALNHSVVVALAESTGTCGSRVEYAPASGGTLTPIVDESPTGRFSYLDDAYDPTVSPDGAKVAWLYELWPPPESHGKFSIIVTTLATKGSHVLDVSETAGGPLSWGGPAGNKLLLGNTYKGVENVETLGPDDRIESHTTLHAPNPGCLLRQAAFVAATNLVAAIESCGPSATIPTRLVEIDASTGTLVRRVITAPSGQGIDDFAFDASGQWLMYSTSSVYSSNLPTKNTFSLNVVHDGRSTTVPEPEGQIVSFAW